MNKNALAPQQDKYGLKTIGHALMGIVVLVAGNILASLPVDLLFTIVTLDSATLSIAIIVIRSLLNIIVPLALLYLYINKVLKKVLKLPLNEFRIGKPENILLWSICALALPLAVSGFFVFFTPGTFATSDFATERVIRYIVRAFFDTCLVAGITEEVIFRGFIMRLLEKRWNIKVAMIVPSVIFGLLHITSMDSPTVIDVLVLLVAGTGVGIMFSMIAYQSGSIWASALVHGVWNFIIIGGILEIRAEPFTSIFSYTLASKSTLLTGGEFGIESSMPAIVGYAVIALIAWLLHRRSASKSGAPNQ